MKRILLVLVVSLAVWSAVSAQDEEWIRQQEQMIDEGYLTIFDMFAYKDGDYIVLDDGSIAIPGRPTTEEERKEIEMAAEKGRHAEIGQDRIRPTRELGLFIINQNFSDYLFRSRLGTLISKIDFKPEEEQEGIVDVISYLLPGKSRINCYTNRFGKIHYIDVIISASFEDDQKILTMDDLLTIVLQATGLPYSMDDIYSALKSLNSKNYWNGWLFGMTAYVDHVTFSARIRIMSPYDYNEDDPYKVMEIFGDDCDENYIGACIPVSARDLNCSDVRMRNFFVVGTDKHRLDGDKNGVCCEPYPIF